VQSVPTSKSVKRHRGVNVSKQVTDQMELVTDDCNHHGQSSSQQQQMHLPLPQRVMPSCPWRDGINTCFKCGKATLSSGEPLFRRLGHMQFVCMPCAQDQGLHEYEGVSRCARDILENFALSEMGFYHCEDCSEVFCSEMDAMKHTNASRKVMQSQCMLAGPYVETGKGAIVPYIDPVACPSAMTTCKYCGKSMQVDQWIHHVRTECTMVPCALCLESISDAATSYARQKLGERNKSATLMHCERIFEPFNKAPQCCYKSGTFKEMVRHMQVPSEEHCRGLQCLREFVMHVDKELAIPISAAQQVVPSPLQLVTIGATSFSHMNVDNGSNQRGSGTPGGGAVVSCKSPREATDMVVNVSGKCPETIRHQKEEAEARVSDLKKKKKKKKKKTKTKTKKKKTKTKIKKTKNVTPGKEKVKKPKKSKKAESYRNNQVTERLPIRLLMKRKKEEREVREVREMGEDGKKQQRQQEQTNDRPTKRARRQIESPAITFTETMNTPPETAQNNKDDTTTTTNTITTTTATMITPSMIAKSWVTSSESDPTLRVVVVKPRATKARSPPPPPPPSKAKARPKPPPPPYPPPMAQRA